MIIKSVKIKSFAGLKDVNLNFHKGFNLIYGENEKGKSTIQGFIKLWLYGIPNDKSTRGKYLPLSGENMEGELRISHENKEYIISRIFGKTKKSDSLKVIDVITGAEVKFDKKEIGEVLLGVSEKTFVRTLFIGQQNVVITKDKKEDQIKEKLQNIFSIGNEDVSVEVATEKLKENKKLIQNNRKPGTLDKVNENLYKLNQEYYKVEALIEENIEREVKLKQEKNKKSEINESLANLEVYKKHIKQIGLKREYEDIIKYFNKSEDIKKEEKDIEKELVKGDRIIDLNYLEQIEDKYKKYYGFEEKIIENKSYEENILLEKERLEKENEGYEVFLAVGGNIKENLIKLTTEIKNFDEKLKSETNLKLSIEEEEEKLKKKEKVVEKTLYLRDDLNKIKFELTNKEIKNEKKNLSNILMLGTLGALILTIISFVLEMMIGIKLIFIIATGILGFLYMENRRKDEKNEENTYIKSIIESLNLKTKDDLSREIVKLEEFLKEEEIANLRIEERLNRIEEMNIEIDIDKFNQNKKLINSIMKMTNSNNIDELYLKVDSYERVKRKIENINDDIQKVRKNLNDLNLDINKIKVEIIDELRYIENEIKIENGMELIKEYKRKLRRKEELDLDLINIEETYKTLLKERDINEVKKAIDIGVLNEESSEYKREEEVEQEIKIKSKQLIECEKNIKELQGEIKLCLNNSRDINIIKEEIFKEEEKRKELEKRVKALDLSIKALENVDRLLKERFAPEINKNIGKIFYELTGGRYKNVILKEDYSLEVEGESWFSSKYLSNGTKDQLYLSLRLAFIKALFKNIEILVVFDEIFLQYDDIRREICLKYLDSQLENQILLFTCQGIEKDILEKNNIKYKEVCI